MAVDKQSFKGAMGRFASGVTVVTVQTDDGDYGMTASAFTSVSLDPPLILVCVNKGSSTEARLMAARGFGVSLLAEDQKDASNQYAGYGAHPQDHFPEQCVRGGVSGAPLLDGALAWLDCTRHATYDGGDHTIFLGEVQEVMLHGASDDLCPLLYFSGRYRAAGDVL